MYMYIACKLISGIHNNTIQNLHRRFMHVGGKIIGMHSKINQRV